MLPAVGGAQIDLGTVYSVHPEVEVAHERERERERERESQQRESTFSKRHTDDDTVETFCGGIGL